MAHAAARGRRHGTASPDLDAVTITLDGGTKIARILMAPRERSQAYGAWGERTFAANASSRISFRYPT